MVNKINFDTFSATICDNNQSKIFWSFQKVNTG